MSTDLFGAPVVLAQRPRDALVGHADYLRFEHDGRTAFVRRGALHEMWLTATRHAKRKAVEVAFLCMGRRAEDALGPYTVLDQLGWLALGTATSVRVSAEDKERVLRAWPSLDVVGWAHTHPGFGVVFSVVDLVTCEDFGEAALNLVVDPLRRELGVARGGVMVGTYSVPRAGFVGRSAVSRWLRAKHEEVELWPISTNVSSAPTA